MLVRVLQSIHGHLGMLATAALIHPAVVLRKGKPLGYRSRWAVSLSTAFTVLAYSAGIAIYADYRNLVKRALFRADLHAGLLFETKEHLALAVVCLALGALVAALAAPRHATGLRRTAAIVYALAAALCLLTGGLGIYVTSVRGFWG